MPGTSKLSIVLGFRNWGLERLATALADHRIKSARVSIIVVDFGSDDPAAVASLCEKYGAKLVRKEASYWSRAQALNAGIAQADTEYVAFTDADIIFGPGLNEGICATLDRNPSAFVLVQCWDLPPVPLSRFQAEAADVFAQATIRPRWGMGGCCAFRKADWLQIGGLDNRLIVWGGEDNDFVKRLRALGLKPIWLTEPSQRIFHIFHEREKSGRDGSAGFAAIERNNRRILGESAIYRNLALNEPAAHCAAVSVVIATRNRPDFLKACLESIATQSILPWQTIVVDNGERGAAEDVSQAVALPGISYHHLEGAGIAGSRNAATAVCETPYTIVMDDDDLMLPNRIRDHLACLQDGGDVISTGGWINFDHEGKTEYFPGKVLESDGLAFTGRALTHGASMYSTGILRYFPYAEEYRTGTDYDLNMRILAAGARLRHTGSYVLLRRVHAGGVTQADSAFQKSAGRSKSLLAQMQLSDDELTHRRRLGRTSPSQEVLERPSLPEVYRLARLDDLVIRVTVEVSREPSTFFSVWTALGGEGKGFVVREASLSLSDHLIVSADLPAGGLDEVVACCDALGVFVQYEPISGSSTTQLASSTSSGRYLVSGESSSQDACFPSARRTMSDWRISDQTRRLYISAGSAAEAATLAERIVARAKWKLWTVPESCDGGSQRFALVCGRFDHSPEVLNRHLKIVEELTPEYLVVEAAGAMVLQ